MKSSLRVCSLLSAHSYEGKLDSLQPLLVGYTTHLLFPLHEHQLLLPALLRSRIFHPSRTTILPTRKNKHSPPLHPCPLQRLFLRSRPFFPIPRCLGLPQQLVRFDGLLRVQVWPRSDEERTNQMRDELKLEGPLPARAACRRRPATNITGFEHLCGRVVRPFY